MKTPDLFDQDENELREIPGFEGRYATHKDGRIYSRLRHKYLTPATTTYGYACVELHDANGKGHVTNVHRLIAQTWIANPHNRAEINHINGNRADNRAINLEWCTHKQNMLNVYQRKGEHSPFWQAIINQQQTSTSYDRWKTAFYQFKAQQPDADTATETQLLKRYSATIRKADNEQSALNLAEYKRIEAANENES